MRSYLQSRVVLFGLVLSSALLLGGTLAAQTVSLDGVAPITLISSSTTSAVSINPTTGNVIVRSSVGDYVSCQRLPGPTINNFAPTASQVLPSSSITLNWSSSNTTSCTPSQGPGTIWASLGTLPTTGSQTFNAPASTGAITFQLTCSNGGNSVSQTTVVNVQPGTGGNCVTPYTHADNNTFTGIFGPFPAYGARRRIGVTFDGYVSWQFVATAQQGQFGSFDTTGYPGDGDGHGQLSISTDTPGCFDQTKLGQNCLSLAARNTSIGWANGPTQFSCSLTPGRTYFLNYTFGKTTFGGGGQPFCPIGPGNNCGADVLMLQQD